MSNLTVICIVTALPAYKRAKKTIGRILKAELDLNSKIVELE